MSKNKRLVAEIVDGENVIMTIDRNMLSCEFGALDRGNLTDVVNWGIYANRGSISFIDNIGFFNNKNVNSSVIKNYTVKFYLRKYEHQKILLATFKIDDVDFEEETREVNIGLVSKIISLQKEKTTSSVYPFYIRSLSELLSDIKDTLPNARISIGEDSENINNTFIGCPYIGIDTAWNVLTKICQASMSRLVEAENGDLELTSSFPERIPIIVEPNNIINIDNADFVRVENASIDVTERTIYEKFVLDGSSKSFVVKRDEQQGGYEIDGFTTTNWRGMIDGKKHQEYVSGTLIFNTPYKIFSLYIDQSTLDKNLKMGKLENKDGVLETVEVTENKSYSASTVLCSNRIVLNETDISATIDEFNITNVISDNSSYFHEILVTGGKFRFPISTFVDNGTYTLSIKSNSDGETIQSNDLIQNNSTRYISSYEGSIGLGNYILQEVKKRYSNGIECFEIECLFNDYYYEDGSLAFNGDDLSQHFNKYDVIIPYTIRKGKTVPLRSNEDGTPKKFRIIGISYSYDGLLKQKLSLHEERYDVD